MSRVSISMFERVLDKCGDCLARRDQLGSHGRCAGRHGGCIYGFVCDEAETLRALVELARAARSVARVYGETLCQGNEGGELLDAIDALFEKEAGE